MKWEDKSKMDEESRMNEKKKDGSRKDAIRPVVVVVHCMKGGMNGVDPCQRLTLLGFFLRLWMMDGNGGRL